MRTSVVMIAALALASTAFAQLDPYTLTVTASRSISVQPDQASLSVYVDADASLGLNDILNVVQGLGLTQANLSSVYNQSSLSFTNSGLPTPPVGLEWSFSLTVPYSSLKDTLTALGALQAKLAKQSSGPMLLFSVNGVQVSPQLQAAQTCPTAAMIADAKTQAQALAQAAGFGLGQISTITDGGGGVVGTVGVPSIAAYRVGFVNVGEIFTQTVNTTTNCAIVVKFKLTLSQ